MSDALETRIRAILEATPIENLGTITAKDVRAQLLAAGAVDEAWVKANKKSLNTLIAGVFEEVSAPLVPVQPVSDYAPKEEYTNGEAYSEPEATESQMDEYGDENGDANGGPSTPPPPKPHKKKTKTKRELTDEEYARQLSSQLNGRSRSSRSGKTSTTRVSKPKKGVTRTPKRNKKSAEHVDDSDAGSGADDYADEQGSKPTKKRKSRKSGESAGAKGGFSKEYILSEPLSALLEVDRLSRPQVVKRLWDYIKGNDLQNPNNKKEILCDDRLRPVFNADKIDMFKMNKVLGLHLHEAE